jgi:hypothetical protein
VKKRSYGSSFWLKDWLKNVILTCQKTRKKPISKRCGNQFVGASHWFFSCINSSNIANFITSSALSFPRIDDEIFNKVWTHVWSNYYGLYYAMRQMVVKNSSILGTTRTNGNARILMYKHSLFMCLLLSSSATVKYSIKVGENLIFLSIPIEFIVKFGRHIGTMCACASPSCPIFLVMTLSLPPPP